MRTRWLPTRKTINAAMHGMHDGARGYAAITLDRVNGKICFKLSWSGIGSPVAAHIHDASGGAAVVPLFVDSPKRKGCVRAPKSVIRKIAECPGRYRVTLHTECYPKGALQAAL
jgi:CHRD domain